MRTPRRRCEHSSRKLHFSHMPFHLRQVASWNSSIRPVTPSRGSGRLSILANMNESATFVEVLLHDGKQDRDRVTQLPRRGQTPPQVRMPTFAGAAAWDGYNSSKRESARAERCTSACPWTRARDRCSPNASARRSANDHVCELTANHSTLWGGTSATVLSGTPFREAATRNRPALHRQ